MIARASAWTSGEVAAAVGGRLYGDAHRALIGVATDTRDTLRDHLFVALKGERFDAHNFLAQAVASGAGALLVEAGRTASTPRIEVQDTLQALGALAQAHRRKFPSLLVHALTGSNGKTSTKEMLAAILAEAGSVLKTEGNLNNLIGLPMTLLAASAAHRYAVLEMGMNSRGEIARLAEIAAPDVGLVINVGPAHIGELGSQEAVAEAKGELFTGLPRGAAAVANLDDPWVMEMVRRSGVSPRTFGAAEKADVRLIARAPSGEGQKITLSIDGVVSSFELPYPGAHNAMNAAAAVAAATARVTLTPEAIARGLAEARRVAGRLIVENIGPYQVIDDCYNANGASMLAAIDTVAERVAASGGRLVALLGEMRELGAFSAQEHARVGEALAQKKAAIAAAFGPDAKPIAGAAKAGGVGEVKHESSDVNALYDWLKARLQKGDVILVKGSRGIHMERFIALLKEAR